MSIEDVLQFPEKEKISKLIDLLDDRDWNLRKRSHEELIKIGSPAELPVLKRIINTDNNNISFWGIKILSNMKVSGKTYLLEIYDKKKDDKEVLSELLSSFKNLEPDDDIIEVLITELGNKRWSIRQVSSRTILHYGKICVSKLKQAFNHGNKDIRYWTVKIIGQILGENAIDPFVKLLNSKSNDLRYYAITALGEIDSEKTIEPIINAFSDRSWLVRNQAAEVLENKGQIAVKYLVDAFTGDDLDKRFWSLKTLTKIIKEDAIDLLKNYLKEDDTDLKFHFIASLQEIGNKKSIDLLITWLDNPTWLIRKSAANALIKIGKKAIPQITDILKSSDNENLRYWSVRILSELGEEGMSPLLSIVKTSGKKEKIFIIKAFKNSSEMISPLIDLLEDESWTIRNTAAEAILESDPKNLIKTLSEIMDYESSDKNYWIKKILRKNDSLYEDAIERYIGSNEIDKVSLYKLLAFGATDTYVDLLVKILREGNLTIREELENSLRGFGDEDLMKLFLKKLETVSSEIAFWLYRLIISTNALSPEIVIKEISSSSSDKLIWLAKIMGEMKHEEFIQPLLGFLSSSNKNVRYEATKILAKFSNDVLTSELLDHFQNEDEEGKIAIIENFSSLSSNEVIISLLDKLEEISEKDGYWIAKLLAETAKDEVDFLKKIENKHDNGKKKSYWLKRIIEHMEGKSYL